MNRLDWTLEKYDFNKIDLSFNICYDRKLINDLNSLFKSKPTDFRSYPNEGVVYKILSNFYGKSSYNIAVGYGLSELISRLLLIFKNNKINIVSPTWTPVEALAKSYSVKYTLNDDSACDILYVANPNGKTGKLLNKDDVLNLCKVYEYVILDEAYHDFSNDESSLNYQPKNLIVLKTLSKSLSVAGIRCGYAFADREIIFKLQEIRPAYITNSIVVNYLEDLLCMIDTHVNRMLKTRDYLESKYNCSKSYANFVLFNENPLFIKNFITSKSLNFTRMSLLNIELLND